MRTLLVIFAMVPMVAAADTQVWNPYPSAYNLNQPSQVYVPQPLIQQPYATQPIIVLPPQNNLERQADLLVEQQQARKLLLQNQELEQKIYNFGLGDSKNN